MTESSAPTPAAVHDCWNRIGVAGDRSCPALQQYTVCRNCPVYESAAASFFDRRAPEGYLEAWARQLAEPVEPPPVDDVSVLIFRLADEWLALATRAVVEVTKPRPVHRIPHRSNHTLVGLVNLRGQLQLEISLQGLLGGGAEAAFSAAADALRRLVVIRLGPATWAFTADEVGEVTRVSRSSLVTVPSTLANVKHSYTQAVIPWKGKTVGFLDEIRVFAALKGFGR